MQVDELVNNSEHKFKWRMMLISMKDVKVLIEFFKSHVVNIKRGAKVLLERIEDFSEMSLGGGVADFSGIGANSMVGMDDDMYAGSGIQAASSTSSDLDMSRSSTMSQVREDHFSSMVNVDHASAAAFGGGPNLRAQSTALNSNSLQ